MPISARLVSRRIPFEPIDGGSLGAHVRKRRQELGLLRVQAAAELGVDPKTLTWWERDARPPIVSVYPRLISFLGFEPWAEPRTLADALLCERRRRGLEIRRAAALAGVDEGTWRRWERGEWKPTRVTLRVLDELLGYTVATRFPHDVR